MDSGPSTGDTSNPMLGIALKCMSVVVFVGMQTAIKAGGEGIPAGEIVFFRSFFALVPVVIYLAWLGDLGRRWSPTTSRGHICAASSASPRWSSASSP